MRFTFKYCNDFGEVADGCCRCGEPTRDRCAVAFQGVRLTVWACRDCRYFLSSFFTIFGEWFLRSVFAANDAREAGRAVAEYSNAFNFDWNDTPLTKKVVQSRKRDRRGGAEDRPAFQ